ncbi:hypothetical protein KUTeg_014818 [Tegillarca granosa]|uniref:Uncharacterized protein n=1 Tax=Tegillarca granosa TaxID=220873 RepID=A0ABQ9EQV3_TEGGR|nr:hypothetical protein KUTeg_014818 [Tegillarca granosa]
MSATRKRILDWLDKEKWDNKIQSKCCQTEVDKKTKETLISPVTVTLWCGTKNFGSQFPPASRDCAIQTSVQVNNAQAN